MMGKEILKEYVASVDNNTMQRGKLPIKPIMSFTPLVPAEKWNTAGGAVTKKFMFREKELRNIFIQELLCLEENTHAAPAFVVRPDSVTVSLMTKNVEEATEIDKEFARACDLLYKSVVM